MKKVIETMYLDYVNNFLSVICFAEYYDITTKKAYRIIRLGKRLNSRKVGT
jgi:hypothetical protein